MSGNQRAHLRVPQLLGLWCTGYCLPADHFIKFWRYYRGCRKGPGRSSPGEVYALSDPHPRRPAQANRVRRSAR